MMKYFIAIWLLLCTLPVAYGQQDLVNMLADPPGVFPGTEKLTWDFDVAGHIVAGAHQYIEQEIDRSVESRKPLWKRDLSSPAAYVQSVNPNRLRFMKVLGIPTDEEQTVQYNTLDAATPTASMEKYGKGTDPVVVAETSLYRIHQVRWSVDGEFSGEGLL